LVFDRGLNNKIGNHCALPSFPANEVDLVIWFSEGTSNTAKDLILTAKVRLRAFVEGRSLSKKLRTVTLARALLVASVPSLTTTAQARGFGYHGGGGFGGFHGGGWEHGGWGHGGWGWGGV